MRRKSNTRTDFQSQNGVRGREERKMRLIDADALIQIFEEDEKNLVDREFQLAAIGAANTVRNMPTVDAEPVRHGQWLSREEGVVYPFWERYTCSACGKHADNTEYCPHCGARMVKDD